MTWMEEDEWFLAQGAGWIVMPFAEIGQTRGEAGLADGGAQLFLLERDMYGTAKLAYLRGLSSEERSGQDIWKRKPQHTACFGNAVTKA